MAAPASDPPHALTSTQPPLSRRPPPPAMAPSRAWHQGTRQTDPLHTSPPQNDGALGPQSPFPQLSDAKGGPGFRPGSPTPPRKVGERLRASPGGTSQVGKKVRKTMGANGTRVGLSRASHHPAVPRERRPWQGTHSHCSCSALGGTRQGSVRSRRGILGAHPLSAEGSLHLPIRREWGAGAAAHPGPPAPPPPRGLSP